MKKFLVAIGYGVAQILQLAGGLVYPLDEWLIYRFSLAIAPSFLLSMLAFRYTTQKRHRFFCHTALLFA